MDMSDNEEYIKNTMGIPWLYIEEFSTKPSGWCERYNCGCLTEVKYKKDLLGYCPDHGLPSKEVIPFFF